MHNQNTMRETRNSVFGTQKREDKLFSTLF